MLATVYSGAVYGVDAYSVEIEVNAGQPPSVGAYGVPGGDPQIVTVGLPDAAVVEGLEVHPIRTLPQAADFLNGDLEQSPVGVDLSRAYTAGLRQKPGDPGFTPEPLDYHTGMPVGAKSVQAER